MRIVFVHAESNSAPSPSVEEANDLTRLQVEAGIYDVAIVTESLYIAGFGKVVDGYAWLPTRLLLTSFLDANKGNEDEAENRWEGLLSFAKAHGWLSSDGRSLRAHITNSQTDLG